MCGSVGSVFVCGVSKRFFRGDRVFRGKRNVFWVLTLADSFNYTRLTNLSTSRKLDLASTGFHFENCISDLKHKNHLVS